MLSDVLYDAEHYDEVVNTAAMGGLVELGAVEALPFIRRAFELGRIDEMVYGPWGDVLDDLGIEPEEGDPLLAESRRRFEERHERLMPREQREQLLQALDRFREGTLRSRATACSYAPVGATRSTQNGTGESTQAQEQAQARVGLTQSQPAKAQVAGDILNGYCGHPQHPRSRQALRRDHRRLLR
jgi:hypothetical protein